MAINKEKDLKLFYSIGEVARMFGVNESLLRFWEKEFTQIAPRKTSGGTRQYRKEDIEAIKIVHHLVKERGMTLPGARQHLEKNKGVTERNVEVLDRLNAVKAELLAIKRELDGFQTSKFENNDIV